MWSLDQLTRLHRLVGHTGSIHQAVANGPLLLTRDTLGAIVVWDTLLATSPNLAKGVPCIRKLDLVVLGDKITKLRRHHLMKVERGDLVTISCNMRQLAVARTDGITVMEFWNSADNRSSDRIGVDGEVSGAGMVEPGEAQEGINADIQKLRDFQNTLQFK